MRVELSLDPKQRLKLKNGQSPAIFHLWQMIVRNIRGIVARDFIIWLFHQLTPSEPLFQILHFSPILLQIRRVIQI
jgi:hypothetical protein